MGDTDVTDGATPLAKQLASQTTCSIQ